MRRNGRQIIKEACVLLWKDIKDAKWVIIFIIAYFAFLKIVVHKTCPMVIITGFPCPACGLTRAGVNLLHLDFVGAFHMHPFIYPIIVFVALFGIRRYIQKRKGIGKLKILAAFLLAGMVAYYIWRMVMYFPGDPPMGYYQYNFINRIGGLLGS